MSRDDIKEWVKSIKFQLEDIITKRISSNFYYTDLTHYFL